VLVGADDQLTNAACRRFGASTIPAGFIARCLPALIPLPYPWNERLDGRVMRPALAGVVVHCRKAIQPRDIWIVAHIGD
jgi:hypothetical protein